MNTDSKDNNMCANLRLRQEAQYPEEKKTMSVPEMRRLLGLKKTEGYWLVHRHFFETKLVGDRMRVDIESFEKWYANQVKHKKVNGEPPGKELRTHSYSFREAANLLGTYSYNLYEIWKKENRKTFEVDFVRRIPKEDFDAWYDQQDKYCKVGKVLTPENLKVNYYFYKETAALLGVTEGKMLSLLRSEEYRKHLEIRIYDDKPWIYKKSFCLFVNTQNAFKTDKNEKQPKPKEVAKKTKNYLSRQEAADLAGVTVSTITKWIHSEKFSCVRIGKILYIDKSTFMDWLNKREEGV